MASYDLKRLEVAIQYIRRMSDGKNPVTNRPTPENEVLNNMNVHRCLKFIDEVLTDVHKAGGTVGMVSQRAPKQSVLRDLPLRGTDAVPVSAGPTDFLLPEAARGISAGRSKDTRPRHNDHTVDA